MHIIPNPTRGMKTCEYWINEEVITTGNFNNFAIVLFSGDDTVTLNGETIGRTLIHDYGNFKAFSCETIVDFMFEYTRFKQIHKHDLERIYTALTAMYSPIENYDKHSEIENDGNTGANPDNPFTTRVYQVSDDTVNGTGDAAFIPQAKTTTQGKTDTYNKMTEHTHGNIGVTKSADMVLSEIQLRVQHNMIETVCRMFAEMELI